MAGEKNKGMTTAERILASIAAAPAAPEGPCLDDGQVIEYALEMMDEAKRAQAAKHVETCPACLDEVIALLEERRYWEKKESSRDRAESFLPGRTRETTAEGDDPATAPRKPPRRR